MKHASLFSGIGGFDLAAEWMGWDNVFHCEFNPFCQKILKHYWPKAKSYGDIDETDFTFWRGLIDVLTGGFPCQPYSHAGSRKGKEDDRHKWPQMLRAIREIQPPWIVGENVRGLTNWNGGLVFDEVQADLEAEGYEVTPFLLPACGINAPHRRERIWFIAYSETFQRNKERQEIIECESGGIPCSRINGTNGKGIITNTGGIGSSEQGESKRQLREKTFGNGQASWSYNVSRWPTEPPVCFGNDGLPTKLDGITVSDWAEQSLSGAGNAVVPQVVFEIFKTIQSINNVHPY